MIVFVSANSVDPDEMPHHVAFHLGLHCLPKYAFRSHKYIKQRVNFALTHHMDCIFVVVIFIYIWMGVRAFQSIPFVIFLSHSLGEVLT